MQHILEAPDGSRSNVTEWRWMADCNERGYQCLIRQPALLIYRMI